MRNLGMRTVKLIAVVLPGVLLLGLADAAAITFAVGTHERAWLTVLTKAVVCVAIGIAAGRLLGKRWYLATAAPVLYFGIISVLLSDVRHIWLNLQMPLALTATVIAGYCAAGSSEA